MSNRSMILLNSAAAALALSFSFARSSAAAGPSRSDRPLAPNIVLIVADDQRWTDFGFMGHPVVQTPNLDRLAGRSALFRRGYVPTSLCRPSLASLITGLYPHQHGITGNDPPRGMDRAALLSRIRAVPTLPRLLREKGYRSFQSGKWWEGNFAEGGFTAGMTHGDPRHGGRHGDEGLRIGREGLKPVFDFIERGGAAPYFIWFAPMMPHVPHTPPRRLLAKYTSSDRPIAVAKYFAMCEWFDEACGELLDYLDRRGDAAKTLVIFVVDNGWAPPETGQTGVGGKPAPFALRTKLSPYDGGIRTPIIVSWPGRISPANYATLASSIDIAPTILAAAGLAKDAAMPGCNLLDIIAAGGACARTAVFGEIYTHDIASIEEPARGLRDRWCVAGHWKLIAPAGRNGPLELYDLLSDPFEQCNRVQDCPCVAQELSAAIDAWWPISR